MLVLYYYYCVIALCGGQGGRKLAYNAAELCHLIIIKRNEKNESLVYIFEYFAEILIIYVIFFKNNYYEEIEIQYIATQEVKENKTNNEYDSISICTCLYIILYMYIEPYTCLNMHKYINLT